MCDKKNRWKNETSISKEIRFEIYDRKRLGFKIQNPKDTG